MWIVSLPFDLCFFIASPIWTYLCYFLYMYLRSFPENSPAFYDAAFIVTMIFHCFFDQPHIFQTLSRTHRDQHEFVRRRFLYTYGLGILLFSGLLLFYWGYYEYFLTVLSLFGIWHILRQNIGLLKLYQKRDRSLPAFDKVLDQTLLYGSFGVFLLLNWLNNPSFIAYFGDFQDGWDRWVFFSYALLFGFFVSRQALGMTKKSLARLLFLFSIISTQYFVYVYSQVPFMLFVALETIYHNVQYFGWQYYYHHKTQVAPQVWRRLLALSLIYGLLFGAVVILSIYVGYGTLLVLPFTMLVFFHYYIDGKIWKSSRHGELKPLFD